MGLGGTKPHALDLTRNAIPNEPWWQMEHLLYTEAQQQRVTTLAGRPNHQHLLTGIDWHAYKQLKPKLPAHFRDATAAVLEARLTEVCPATAT